MKKRIRGCDSVQSKWVRVLITMSLSLSMTVSCSTVPPAGAGPRQSSGHTEAPQARATTPTDPRAYYHFLSGYQAELSQDQEKAILEYQLALRGDPTSIFLKSRIAALLFSTGQLATAVEFADRIPITDVSDATTLVQLAGIYAGSGQTEKALDLYDQAILKDPG